MNWQDEDEVFKAKLIGEMASILIKAMEWEKEYKLYKTKMYDYLKSDQYFKSVNKNNDTVTQKQSTKDKNV